jgi:hypothetical protein
VIKVITTINKQNKFMDNCKNKPQETSADLQRSPFFTVEDWRRLFASLFNGEDKRDDADILARYLLLLRDALDQGECQHAKTSLKSAIVAAKEFGRFADIELNYYRDYLLGHFNTRTHSAICCTLWVRPYHRF